MRPHRFPGSTCVIGWGLAVAGFAGCVAATGEIGGSGPPADSGRPADSGAPASGGAVGSGGRVGSGGAPGSGGITGGSGGRGSGGAFSSGGATGSGGRASSGGATGSGGRANSGGATGSGGRANSGGATGSGGRANSGGATGSAGRAGTGGATGSGGSANACAGGTPPSGGTQHCSSNMSGSLAGGYAYTIWSSGSGGCITPYGVGAAFKANWNNSGDFLARVGLPLQSNKTFDQYGAFSADFAETKTGSAGGYSYIGIYGWSVNPLHEYYIIDDWYGSRPNPGTKVGTVTLDGGTYDILTKTQTNQPAITGGNATFVQFWSLRTTPRTCGHISISEHFKAWKNMGLTLGNMEEVKILIEAGGGTGSIDFTSATVTAQ